MCRGNVDDKKLVRVAKYASIIIAPFSFLVAPLLQYAPDGLWQIIRIFTGCYNIPVIVEEQATDDIATYTKNVESACKIIKDGKEGTNNCF